MTRHPSRFLVAATLAAVAMGSTMQADSDQVLAVVNGKAITEAEVRSASSNALQSAERDYQHRRAALEREHERQLHDVIEGGLDRLIDDRLIDLEAAARGVPREAILSEIKAPEVTDDDVSAFYEKNRARMNGPREQMLPRIKSYLEEEGRNKARGDYFEKLKSKYKVDIRLEPIRVAVAATGPAVGPADAPVTIVEFSDFQCPFCRELAPTLEKIVAMYGHEVRIVYRQFPLPIHADAAKAAEASLCANEQGKFWELHDAMYKDQKALGVEKLKAAAASLGLDADAFGKCLDSGRTAATVENDVKDGSEAGVDGTPALFINGRLVAGAVPMEEITKVIDDELRRHHHG